MHIANLCVQSSVNFLILIKPLAHTILYIISNIFCLYIFDIYYALIVYVCACARPLISNPKSNSFSVTDVNTPIIAFVDGARAIQSDLQPPDQLVGIDHWRLSRFRARISYFWTSAATWAVDVKLFNNIWYFVLTKPFQPFGLQSQQVVVGNISFAF